MLCLSSRSTPYSTDPREYKQHEVSEGNKRKKGLTFLFSIYLFILKWQQVLTEQDKKNHETFVLKAKLDFYQKRKKKLSILWQRLTLKPLFI